MENNGDAPSFWRCAHPVGGDSRAITPLLGGLILMPTFLLPWWIWVSWFCVCVCLGVLSLRIPFIAPLWIEKITIAVERCFAEFQVGWYVAEKHSSTKCIRYSSLYLTSCSRSAQGSNSSSPCAYTSTPASPAGSPELPQTKFSVTPAARPASRRGGWEATQVIDLKCISQDTMAAILVIKFKHDSAPVPGKFSSAPPASFQTAVLWQCLSWKLGEMGWWLCTAALRLDRGEFELWFHSFHKYFSGPVTVPHSLLAVQPWASYWASVSFRFKLDSTPPSAVITILDITITIILTTACFRAHVGSWLVLKAEFTFQKGISWEAEWVISFEKDNLTAKGFLKREY